MLVPSPPRLEGATRARGGAITLPARMPTRPGFAPSRAELTRWTRCQWQALPVGRAGQGRGLNSGPQWHLQFGAEAVQAACRLGTLSVVRAPDDPRRLLVNVSLTVVNSLMGTF